MTTWRELLSEKGVLLSDGAWGTEFARRGLEPGEAPERLNLEHPETVRQVAASYVEAGSDIILTNTFGGSRLKLERAGLADRVAEANRRGVEISKAAAGAEALVFASVGPTGEFMEPVGTISRGEMVGVFAEQVDALAEAGADGIVIETMADLGEAKAALAGAREACDLPVVVCMSFDKGARGYATMMGVTPERAAQELTAEQPELIGSNCGRGPADLVEITRILHEETDLPLWIKPNAGVPKLVDGETVYAQTPEEMAGYFANLVEAGASVIGGCCGSTPEHIRRLAQAREQL
ncbi:MAG: homocysteine S-methyltransferase family protein [Candidatus Brocadiia bacterium]